MGPSLQADFERLNCCVIVPTYNNQKTILQVIDDLKQYTTNIIVVNDGSTDDTPSLLQTTDVNICGYEKNKGKGYALRHGFKEALKQGYRYAITIDSDGQHYAKDLKVFLEQIEKTPDALLIGSRFMEGKNQSKASGFANRFSNFWFRVETGLKLEDTQSGYRLYPIKALEKKRWVCSKYEFEIEIIVRAAWEGLTVQCVPIDVFYPTEEERVTHFRPFKDFFRISVLNTILVLLAFLIYRPRLIYKQFKGKSLKEIYQTYIFDANESNNKIAWAIGFGVFMGIFPVWGYQLLIGFIVAHWLKLNKFIFFLAANISLPPMIPVILYLSYVMGSFLLGQGSWHVDMNLDLQSIQHNIKQYLIGAVGLSVVMGLLAYIVSYVLISLLKKGKQ